MAKPRIFRRCAFTLVELLVVASIVGLIAALLLPAMQLARESARRTKCQNQLRQWGVVVALVEQCRGAFPAGYHTVSPTGTCIGTLLPYVEQGSLGYDPARDWNDAVNQAAVITPLAIIHCPSSPLSKPRDVTFSGLSLT